MSPSLIANREQTVLIHSATSAVGLAAIQIAQIHHAEASTLPQIPFSDTYNSQIFATVSTMEKRQYLMQNYHSPGQRIFSSRDTSFLANIMVATAGQGVNIVLNFLSGDLLAASWRACASFGRFMKVGKRDIVDSGRLDMKPFLKNLTFSVFDLNDLFYIALESNHQRDIYQRSI